MKNRREFLKIAAASGVGAFSTKAVNGFSNTRARIEVFSKPEMLGRLIGQRFGGIALESGSRHSLELVEVKQAPVHWAKSTSLVFESNKNIDQDIYRISHPDISTFEALVVPVGNEPGVCEIVIS